MGDLPDLNFNHHIKNKDKMCLFFNGKNIRLKDDNGKIIEALNIEICIFESILINGIIKNAKLLNDFENFSLEMISEDGWKIVINTAYFNNISQSSGKFSAEASDFNAKKGDSNITEKFEFIAIIENFMILDKFETQLNLLELNNLDVMNHDSDLYQNLTGLLKFKSKIDELNELRDIVNKFNYLSMIFSNKNSNLKLSYIVSDNLSYKEINILSQIDIINFENIELYQEYSNGIDKFFNLTFNQYFNLGLDLKKLVYYHIGVENQIHSDYGLISGIIFLEVLKDIYAKDFKNYQKKANHYINPINNRFYNFKYILNEIFEELDLNIVKIGNYIDGFHPDNYYSMMDELLNVRNLIFCDEKISDVEVNNQFIKVREIITILLLKIFDVKCDYWDKINKKWVNSEEFLENFKL